MPASHVQAAESRRAILVVCTANQCRSPVVAAVLRRRLAARDISIRTESAGLGAGGFPATPSTCDAANRIGIDLSSHESRQVDADLIARADLVITLERRHTREIVVLDSCAWTRTFTLKELVRRGAATGPPSSDESLQSWLCRLQAGRRRHELLGASPDDDVLDPTVDALADYDSMVREADSLVAQFVELAWPEARSRLGGG